MIGLEGRENRGMLRAFEVLSATIWGVCCGRSVLGATPSPTPPEHRQGHDRAGNGQPPNPRSIRLKVVEAMMVRRLVRRSWSGHPAHAGVEGHERPAILRDKRARVRRGVHLEDES